MLNNVLSRCILWIMGCLLLKETFRNIQKRMDCRWASFFRILAAVMTLLVITLRTPGIQHSSDGHDYLMIREYMLGEKKYAIEYSPQSQFAKLFKTYQFQNEIRSSL